jgi:hypothetical protein
LKSIDTLIPDLEALLTGGLDSLDPDIVEAFGKRLAETMASRLKREPREFTLRMSNIGKPCLRQLWLERVYPDKVEKLNASTLLKFQYGDLLEELLLFLAELSGHRVEGRQDTQRIGSIVGHRDAVIDGVVVDVKSASTFSFGKFKNHLSKDTDAFGYIDQLQSYLHGSQGDAIVTDKGRGAFLVIDKTLGHLCLDFHKYVPKDWEGEYERRIEIVNGTEIPNRAFRPEPDGKSGNTKLGVNCSYCSVKTACYPGLRAFKYYGGPTFLVNVAREPNVEEIKL